LPEEKKYKYNAYCGKDLHTNSPMPWINHLKSCPICLKAIPQEEVDKLNDKYRKNIIKPEEVDSPPEKIVSKEPEKFEDMPPLPEYPEVIPESSGGTSLQRDPGTSGTPGLPKTPEILETPKAPEVSETPKETEEFTPEEKKMVSEAVAKEITSSPIVKEMRNNIKTLAEAITALSMKEGIIPEKAPAPRPMPTQPIKREAIPKSNNTQPVKGQTLSQQAPQPRPVPQGAPDLATPEERAKVAAWLEDQERKMAGGATSQQPGQTPQQQTQGGPLADLGISPLLNDVKGIIQAIKGGGGQEQGPQGELGTAMELVKGIMGFTQGMIKTQNDITAHIRTGNYKTN